MTGSTFSFTCRSCGEIVSVTGWCQCRDCAFEHIRTCAISSVTITEEDADQNIIATSTLHALNRPSKSTRT